jgi:hypothetical protein
MNFNIRTRLYWHRIIRYLVCDVRHSVAPASSSLLTITITLIGYNDTKYSIIRDIITEFDCSSSFRHVPTYWSVGSEGLFLEVKAVGGVSLIASPRPPPLHLVSNLYAFMTRTGTLYCGHSKCNERPSKGWLEDSHNDVSGSCTYKGFCGWGSSLSQGTRCSTLYSLMLNGI